MNTFASNNQKAKTINLLYRMTNSLLGNDACIIPSPSSLKRNELHKFEINISTTDGDIHALHDNIKQGLSLHGFTDLNGTLKNDRDVCVTSTLRATSNRQSVLTVRVS